MNSNQPVGIVTAASQGIGAACARALARRGYALVVMSRSSRIHELAAEVKGTGFSGSVTKPEDLAALVDAAMANHGRIDAVVNNTGHPPKGALLDIADSEWHEALDLLMLNVVRTARFVTPIMKDQGGGAIVNISAFGAREPHLAFPTSSVIRGSLSNFTKLFADAFAADNIRMNNVLPGYAENHPLDDATRVRIPMRRPGTVQEIGDVVAFLVSDEASYLTGQEICVDGGLQRSR